MSEARKPSRLLAICVAVSLVISLAATFVTARSLNYPLFGLANLVGPTARSLLEGRGLEGLMTVGSLGDPLVFRSARMPMASLVVAGLVEIVGPDRLLLGSLLKAVLFLVPVWAAMRLTLRQVAPSFRLRAAILLLIPFGITAFLADVANLQVEEGYAYSFLAYAFALVLFPDPDADAKRPYRRAVLLGLTLAGLFLTKSSMILVAAILIVAYVVGQKRWGPRLVASLLVLGAVLGWGVQQKSASGRFSLGTSLDGINLHKGNNARFAERYPPEPGQNLDGYDTELSAGQFFVDEWAFDAYHKAEAVRYMREHPVETAREDAKKAFQYFVSLSKAGSVESQGVIRIVETAGLVLFRLGFWAALVLSVRAAFAGKGAERFAGWTFLGVTLFAAAPYLLGFAYTRHASILIYPAALLLCRVLPTRRAEPYEENEAKSVPA